MLPSLLSGRLPTGVSGLGVGLRAARACPSMVRRVRDRGGWVQVFTVDQPRDVDYRAQLGVDGIISNYPARVLHRRARH